MATTVTDATLTVTISEDIVLGGAQRGSRAVQAITVDEYDSRILTVATAGFDAIVKFSSRASAGTYIAANVKYLRITNLDTENFVELIFEATASANEAAIKLDKGESFVLCSMELDATAGNLSGGVTLAAMTEIQAKANTGAVDLELVVASA